jgi:hypothetical protein
MLRTVRFTNDGTFLSRNDFDSSEECANYLGIDEADLNWALEEYGRCDAQDEGNWITAWEPYDRPHEEWPHDPFAGEEGDDEYHPAETLEKIKAGAELMERVGQK